MQRCVIIVATHKNSDMPNEKCYLPLHVGREGNEDFGFTGDNTGDNISFKNPAYSELTGLYWAWKNLDVEYLGLVHYRRFFSLKSRRFLKTHAPMECVITDEELQPILEPATVIVPKKRRYYIETLASHYAHTMNDGKKHLVETRDILMQKYPDYLFAFDRVMKQTSAHMFNMFIMPKKLVDQYCTWLFDILSELENRIDVSHYNAFDKRFLGRVSEILLNVWMKYNQVQYKEIGFIDMWPVNWMNKIARYLLAKIFKKKYNESF